MGALQLFWLGTGFCGLWHPALLASMGALGLLFAVRVLSAGPARRPDATFWRGMEPLSVLGVLVVAWGFGLSLLPETFYDSLAYVLSVPERWLGYRGVVDQPGHLYDGFPLGASVWYLNGLALQGSEAARFLAASVLPACALFAGGWAWEATGERRAGWIAGGVTACFPLLATGTWATRSDALVGLALLAAFHALLRAGGTGKPGMRDGALFGLAFGLALSMKYTALWAVPAFGWVLWKGAAGRPRGDWWAAACLGVAATAGPWWWKNVVFAGNPVFPYLPDLFEGRRLPEWGLARLLYENRISPTSWASWPPLPWRLLTPGHDLSQAVGPWVAAFLPAAILFRGLPASLGAVPGAALLLAAVGLAVTPALRFHFAAFLLFAVLLGALFGSGRLPHAWTRTFRWVSLAAALAGAGMAFDISVRWFDPVGVWTLRESAGDHQGRRTRNPYGPLATWAREAVPPGGRLLLVGDQRGHGYRGVRAEWNSVDDEAFLARVAREGVDAQVLHRAFRRAGVTHLGLNLSEGLETAPDYGHYRRLDPARRDRLKDSCAQVLELVRWEGALALYAVRTPGPRADVSGLGRLFEAGTP
jgi:hypothetical protein